jgi:predicted nucleic acid-binding protein
LSPTRRAQCVDSSVAIAAFGDWHELHSAALDALASSPALVAHAGLEAYSVLTRLPQPFRAPASTVAEYLARNFAGKRLALPAGAQRALPETMALAGVHGGAVYDGLVGLTAKAAGAELLSLDRRAAETYERLGVEYRLTF